MGQYVGDMRHPDSGLTARVYQGFSWPAFLFGPFWYFSKGMPGLGLLIFVLAIPTAFLAWFAAGFMGNRQYRERLARDGYRLQGGAQTVVPDPAYGQVPRGPGPTPPP